MFTLYTFLKMTSKEQIAEGAREVFLRYGYNKASMSDIAFTSRLSRRTIYLHFSNKEEVFMAVIDLEVQQLAVKLKDLVKQPFLPEEKLRRYMQTRMQAVKDLTLYYDALREDLVNNLNIMERLRTEYDQMEVEMIQSILDEGISGGYFEIADTKLVSEAIVLASKGFELPIFMGRTDYDHNRLVSPLIDLLYNGIKKKT
jgi:AcrR family transcriptional regulator